ncbi:MAG: class I SAM-dependent methyltransferase [Candidatus Woesebacteria bacterium]|nr:class I SAM-dependent methyltransferase [Candidatus Woesebacteria bacterium]
MVKCGNENNPPNWYQESIRVDLFQRFWHRKRFNEVSRVIDPIKGKVLDVGCNDGTFSKIIFEKTKTKELVGIDLARKPVDWANRHRKNFGMSFLVGDAHNLKFPASFFDAVFIMEVLEHVADPRLVLAEVKRVLKKGGYGVFLVPSDSFLFRIIWYFWLHFYPRGWVWNHTHIQTYRKNYLTKICRQAGFKIEADKKFNLGMLHLVKVRKI